MTTTISQFFPTGIIIWCEVWLIANGMAPFYSEPTIHTCMWSDKLWSCLSVCPRFHYRKPMGLSVFHLVISNMAQRHVSFCERHVVLHERHVALHVRHVALHVGHVALLIFRQWNASLNSCCNIINPPRPLWQWKIHQSLMSCVHTFDAPPDNSMCT